MESLLQICKRDKIEIKIELSLGEEKANKIFNHKILKSVMFLKCAKLRNCSIFIFFLPGKTHDVYEFSVGFFILGLCFQTMKETTWLKGKI